MENNKPSKKIAYISSIILSLILCLSIVSIVTNLFHIVYNKWVNDITSTWISLFIKLNLGIANRDDIQVLHIIDFIVFILCGTIYFVYFLLEKKKKSVIWFVFTIFALVSFPSGVILLIITHSGGRTGILVASIIFSIITLLNKSIKKLTGIIGVISSVLLLVGCDVLSLNSTNISVGYMIFVGYCIWVIWFLLLSKAINKIKE